MDTLPIDELKRFASDPGRSEREAAATRAFQVRLRTALSERLPDYMVPSQIHVVGSLPRLSSGKIDRKRLVELAMPDIEERPYIAPRNSAEEMLAGLFEDVLSVERASIDSSFFELGGHSLLAAQLIARLRQVLDEELPLRIIFEAPTVETLAARLGEEIDGFAEIAKQLDELDDAEITALLVSSDD